MSIITAGDKGLRDLMKLRKQLEKSGLAQVDPNTWDLLNKDKVDEMALDAYWKRFDKSIEMGLLMSNRFAMIKTRMIEEGKLPYLCNPDKLSKHYTIDISPDTREISFEQFYADVMKFVSRACFYNYTLSFEQKGMCDEELGHRFHCHIVAHMTQRSIGEVARDAKSTFKKYTAEQCINISTLKTKKDLDAKISYITNYTSSDGHKKETQEWDAKWRQKLGLKPLYSSTDASPGRLPSIKSNVGQPIIVEMD